MFSFSFQKADLCSAIYLRLSIGVNVAGAQLCLQFGCLARNGSKARRCYNTAFAVPVGQGGESNLQGAYECTTSSSSAAAAPASLRRSMALALILSRWGSMGTNR